MAISNIKATFQCDVKKAWEVVTSLENYGWRSDIGKIEIISESEFIEYTKDGFATTFHITATVPLKRWEFDMENENIKGHWAGVFSQGAGGTTIDFTEDVSAKKRIMRPFVQSYLNKQQKGYVSDLKAVLNE